jgi:hypothetical protein
MRATRSTCSSAGTFGILPTSDPQQDPVADGFHQALPAFSQIVAHLKHLWKLRDLATDVLFITVPF